MYTLQQHLASEDLTKYIDKYIDLKDNTLRGHSEQHLSGSGDNKKRLSRPKSFLQVIISRASVGSRDPASFEGSCEIPDGGEHLKFLAAIPGVLGRLRDAHRNAQAVCDNYKLFCEQNELDKKEWEEETLSLWGSYLEATGVKAGGMGRAVNLLNKALQTLQSANTQASDDEGVEQNVQEKVKQARQVLESSSSLLVRVLFVENKQNVDGKLWSRSLLSNVSLLVRKPVADPSNLSNVDMSKKRWRCAN